MFKIGLKSWGFASTCHENYNSYITTLTLICQQYIVTILPSTSSNYTYTHYHTCVGTQELSKNNNVFHGIIQTTLKLYVHFHVSPNKYNVESREEWYTHMKTELMTLKISYNFTIDQYTMTFISSEFLYSCITDKDSQALSKLKVKYWLLPFFRVCLIVAITQTKCRNIKLKTPLQS